DPCGLLVVPNNNHQIIKVAGGEDLPKIHSMLEDAPGRFLLGTSDGLFQLHVDKDFLAHDLKRTAIFPYEETIRDLKRDNRNNLWIASKENGLYIYYPIKNKLDHYTEDFNSIRGLLSNRLSCLYKDQKDGMWVAGENGLQSFYNSSSKFYVYPSLSTSSS